MCVNLLQPVLRFSLMASVDRGDTTKIAGFCAHALLILDVLLHPRQIFADIPRGSWEFPDKEVFILTENMSAGFHENKDRIPTPTEMNDSSKGDGELIDLLLDTGKETEEPSKADTQKAIRDYQADHNAKFLRNKKPEPMPEEDIKPFAATRPGCRVK